jgi:hypothetical protein
MIRRESERSRQGRGILVWSVASVTGLMMLATTVGPAAADTEDADWPCQQLLVPHIGWGAVWSGPSIDALPSGAVDPAIQRLAIDLAARKTPIEEAKAKIDAFAKGLPAEHRNEQLTRLFAETLAIVNHDLGSIVGGLKRYARGQQALAERISATNDKLSQLASDQIQERDALATQRDWDMRIYGDRRSSLSYLCEQPYVLEKRAFTLGRTIAAHLEPK